MDKNISKQQVKVILDGAPKGANKELIIQSLVSRGYVLEGFNDQEQVVEEQKVQQEGAKANEFLAKSPMQQIFSKETAKELLPSAGRVIKDVVVDTPVKIAKSLASVPITALSGGKKAIEGTYQSEAKQTASDVIEGKKPLISALTPFLTVPLDVTSTIGLGVGATKLGTKAIESAKPAIAKAQASRALKEVQTIDDTIGKIIQGTPDERNIAKKALSQIDTKGVKTYKDLTSVLDNKINTVSTKLDDVLETTSTETRRLSELTRKMKVGETEVEHNFVDDALRQLDDFYAKTNSIEKKTAIENLIKKAETEGLSVKEINDIAKLHGQDLSGYNASGELASGLSKQSAENTRMGVKTTAREIFGSEEYKLADKEISNLIKTRDLVKDMSLSVNKLEQKIQERGFGEKVGRLVFKVANTFTGGGLKGFVESAIPRGQGYKTLNALDLEKILSSNLKKVNKALNAKTEKDIVNILEDMLNQSKPARNILNIQPTTKIKSNTSNIPKIVTPDKSKVKVKMKN
jgi:hypothetical protein